MELLRLGREIGAPIESVWSIVSDFGGVARWAPEVECSLAGSGIGAIRTIVYPGGHSVRERLERLDTEQKLVEYSMVNGSPLAALRDGICSVRLRSGTTPSSTVVEWCFTAAGEDGGELPELIAGLASRVLDRIERLKSRANLGA